jgi:protein-disulfide isomerase
VEPDSEPNESKKLPDFFVGKENLLEKTKISRENHILLPTPENSTKPNAQNTPKKIKRMHAPSMGIGAGIAISCLVLGIFLANFTDVKNSPVFEEIPATDIIQNSKNSISFSTLLDNGSPFLGSVDAPLTLIEFGDYQCSFCKRHSDQTNHLIIKNYVETGKVKIMFKDLIVVGEDSVSAAHAAHCAKDQEMFWAYHFTLYNNWNGEGTGWITNNNLNRFAEDLELDMNEFSECMSDNRWNDLILASQKDGQALGVSGTPAFFLIGPTDHVSKIDGAQPYSVFVEVFEAELAK